MNRGILENLIRSQKSQFVLMITHFDLILGARLSDSGNIKCIATNVLGKATSNAQLMIEGNIS